MDSLTSGTLLARRYRLLDRIGVGGMSVIWRAHDEMLDRLVAIKVLATALAADERFREQVRVEARAAAALEHPSVTAVYDYGEALDDDGGVAPYVVMELLGGEPLSARLTAGPLPWREAVSVCVAVAGALAAAHRQGVVHRDITPDNIMLTDTSVKVLDFGIATTIGAPDEDEDGATFGTPAYVAPERLDGRKARPETDTYALGVVLFEMLTGHPPYSVESWDELAQIHRDDPPRPIGVPGLPATVAELCRKCLAADPLQRPTASQVARRLRRHLPAAARSARRRVLAVAGSATTLAVGVLIGAMVLNPTTQSAPDDMAVTTPPAEPELRHQPALVTPTWPAKPTVSPAPTQPDWTDVSSSADPPPTPETVLTTVHQLIDEGEANDEIRPDVALDLRQLLHNLQVKLVTGSVDLGAETSSLRDKVRSRAQEGTMSWESAAALDSALAELATAA